MKNTEKSKPTKRKIATYYLSLAACLLIIAAVTVGVIFALRNKTDNVVENPPVDSGNDENIDSNNPQPNPGGDEVVDTSTSYKFIVPINADVSKANTFCYDETLDHYRVHQAMDFNAPAGTEVYAAIDGTVVTVSESSALYGSLIEIEHANGIKTVYKFVTPAEGISVGKKVSRGDVIGAVATATGVENKQGDHLHFEVFKDGKIQNPDNYLLIDSK